MADELTTIATFTNSILAHLAKDVLAMRSIDCFLQDENAASLGYLAVGSLVGIRLQVRKSEAERATHILEQEHFFLLTPQGNEPENKGECEEQFEPEWVGWGDAERMLTYENEKDWLRAAKTAFSALE